MNSQEATDAMLGIVKAVADGPGIFMLYDDVPGAIPTNEITWGRAKVLHTAAGAGSISGASGTTRYQNNGLVWVQLFAPRGDGLVAARAAAQLFVNGFRTARMAVWFRNVGMNEMGSDGAFERIDVKANFQYDTIE